MEVNRKDSRSLTGKTQDLDLSFPILEVMNNKMEQQQCLFVDPIPISVHGLWVHTTIHQFYWVPVR